MKRHLSKMLAFSFVLTLALSGNMYANEEKVTTEQEHVTNDVAKLAQNDEEAAVSGDKSKEVNQNNEENKIVAKKIDSEKSSATKKIVKKVIKSKSADNIISNEKELVDALSDSKENVTLKVLGGSTINLNDNLNINTDTLNKVSITSSNDKVVKIINSNNKKHIQVSGNKGVDLTFNNIELVGKTGILNGGITIVSNTDTNKITGLVAKDNELNSTATGFVTYKSNGGSLLLDNINVSNNKVSGSSINTSMVFVDGNNIQLTIENSILSNNSFSNSSGTSIHFKNVGGRFNLKSSHLENNVSKNGNGALTYIGSNNSKIFIEDSVLNGNRNEYHEGGAVFTDLKDTSSLSMKNTKLNNNYARGGGGALSITAYNGSVIMDTVEMNENKTSVLSYDESTGQLNGEGSYGGAFYLTQTWNDSRSTLNIDNSTFNDNVAYGAGAFEVYNGYEAQTKTVVTNSFINNNKSDYSAGAVLFNYKNTVDVDGLYSILNTEMKNNVVTGKYNGPNIYAGGSGGAIYLPELLEYPNILKLDTVSFEKNKSTRPIVWQYNENKNDKYSKLYKGSVKNTSYTKSDSPGFDSYNNAFNNHDVYVGYDAFVYFTLDKDNFSDLDLQNYDDVDYSTYNATSIGTHVLEPRVPVSPNYEFLGWYDEDGKKWDFDTRVQTNVHERIYGKWQEKKKYNITFDLNEAPTNENENIVKTEVVKEDTKITNPGNPLWKNKAQFDGWYLIDNNGEYTNKWDFENNLVNKDIKLVARWKVNVEFLVDGKQNEDYPMITLDRKQMISNPNKMVWYTDASYKTKVDFSKSVLENTILYAKTDVEVPSDPKPTLPSKPEGDKPTHQNNEKIGNENKENNTKQQLPRTGLENNELMYALISLVVLSGLAIIGHRKEY